MVGSRRLVLLELGATNYGHLSVQEIGDFAGGKLLYGLLIYEILFMSGHGSQPCLLTLPIFDLLYS